MQALDAEFVRASSAALDNPRDLQLSSDGRYLFVSDGDNDRIVVLDPISLKPVGQFGTDELDGPYGLDVDKRGRLYVADSHNNRIAIYEMTRGHGRLMGEVNGVLAKPRGVVAHPNGVVYAAGSWSHNVVGYRGGTMAGDLSLLGTPRDIERTANGDLWISDTSRNELLLVNVDLMIKIKIIGSGVFTSLHAIDVLDQERLIVSEKYDHRVKVVSTAGDLLDVVGTGKPGDGPGELRLPEGVETRAEFLWIADSGNDRVVLYRLLGL